MLTIPAAPKTDLSYAFIHIHIAFLENQWAIQHPNIFHYTGSSDRYIITFCKMQIKSNPSDSELSSSPYTLWCENFMYPIWCFPIRTFNNFRCKLFSSEKKYNIWFLLLSDSGFLDISSNPELDMFVCLFLRNTGLFFSPASIVEKHLWLQSLAILSIIHTQWMWLIYIVVCAAWHLSFPFHRTIQSSQMPLWLHNMLF